MRCGGRRIARRLRMKQRMMGQARLPAPGNGSERKPHMAFERKPPLTIEMIMDWADSHFARTGEWPIASHREPVLDAPEEKWSNIDSNLRAGYRSLPAGLSVARLLEHYRERRNIANLPPYRLHHLLAWADAHLARTGDWPHENSGPIPDAPGESWTAVTVALSNGGRGLEGGSSLAQLLADHRGARNRMDLPPIQVESILAWADAYYERTGEWPTRGDEEIPEAPGDTWHAVDAALYNGRRGLSGGSSLARLLEERRGVRNPANAPPLQVSLILSWADAQRQRTGVWPGRDTGEVPEAPGEHWDAIDLALRVGNRGLSGGSSLARLLSEQRGIRNRKSLPALNKSTILTWADSHHERTNEWPNAASGAIPEAPGETWCAVVSALHSGCRGLQGGSSLGQLLAEHRGIRNLADLPPLDEGTILAWTDAHHCRTGDWPQVKSGPIIDAPGENWASIDAALSRGFRGLPGGSSLRRLLVRHRGARNSRDLPPLNEETILAWAISHYNGTGRWPIPRQGEIVRDAPDENWKAIDSAMRSGARGLPGGDSLARLLERRRGRRNLSSLPPHQVERILAWADAHYQRTGGWPLMTSGPIPDAPGENWLAVDACLLRGNRGLPGGSTLAQLLKKHRGVRNHMDLLPLDPNSILAWADAHYRRTGAWPTSKSGEILDAPGETWNAVQRALASGRRGLQGGSSLSLFLAQHRGNRGGPHATPRVEEPQIS